MSVFSERLTKLLDGPRKKMDLARYLDVGEQAVYKWCQGKNQPSLERVAEIATYLNIDANYLIGLIDDAIPLVSDPESDSSGEA